MRCLPAAVLCLVVGAPSAWAQDDPGIPDGGFSPDEPGMGASFSPTGDGAVDPAASAQAAAGAAVIRSGGFGRPTPLPSQMAQARSKEFSGQVGGGVSFEKLHEDYFVKLLLFNTLTFGPVSFGLRVPLRLRVIDNDPDDDGLFRAEEWDEVSDYARLVHFFELNLGGDSWRFRGRFGELSGESLGHGTLFAGYYNTLDLDHYQAGLVLEFAIHQGGVKLVLDNLLNPEIFGFRVHLRPLSLVMDSGLADRLVFGLTVASDTNAPVNPRGFLVPTGINGGVPVFAWYPLMDDDGLYLYDERRSVTGVGLDLEYALLQNSLVDLVPYVDLNFLSAGRVGVGFHLGAFFNLRIPTPVGPTLLTRLEYRAVGDDYAPRYIDTLYEAQRHQFDPTSVVGPLGEPLTKLGWLRRGDSGTHGWLGEVTLDFNGWLQVGGAYEDYQGPDNAALTLSLAMPKLKVVKIGAFFSRRGFDGWDEAFDLDGALLTAYVQAAVYGPLTLSASYSRTWHARDDGTYQTDDGFSVGAGLVFDY